MLTSFSRNHTIKILTPSSSVRTLTKHLLYQVPVSLSISISSSICLGVLILLTYKEAEYNICFIFLSCCRYKNVWLVNMSSSFLQEKTNSICNSPPSEQYVILKKKYCQFTFWENISKLSDVGLVNHTWVKILTVKTFSGWPRARIFVSWICLRIIQASSCFPT